MSNSVFSMPARRSAAAIGAVVALSAGSLAFAPAAQASSAGTATATVLRAGLDVSLLNNQTDVPLNVVLNDVHAPSGADRKLLTAKLDGVDAGKPFNVLQADVATARATANGQKAEGYSNLVHAAVHLPGLPLRSLIEVQQATSDAMCEAGHKPVAHSNVLGDVNVLGKTVKLSAGGTTTVDVSGVGQVTLNLSQSTTTSTTAVATALDLKVAISQSALNVAGVKGEVTLVRASCETPSGQDTGGSSSSGSTDGGSSSGAGGAGGAGTSSGGSAAGGGSGSGTHTQTTGGGRLAETGGGSSAPYIAAGAVVFIAAGGGAAYAARRKSARAAG